MTDPVVTSTADSGPGSLRQAFADACDGSLVTFDLPGTGPQTITLTSGPLSRSNAISVLGPFDKSVRISGNHSSRVFDFGGAEYNLYVLTIMDGAADTGAGVYTNDGRLTIIACTLSGNVAAVNGGAIAADGPDSLLAMAIDTVSGNSAPEGSGMRSDAAAFIFNSTVTANSGAGGAILSADGGVLAANSIIAGNDGPAISATVATFVDAAANLLVGDPKLGPLQNNGGPTPTHMPLPGSPAIDQADMNYLVEPIDQRGFSNPAGRAGDVLPAADIGAVEVVPTLDAIADMTTSEDTSSTTTFHVGSTWADLLGAEVTEPVSFAVSSSDQAIVPDANLVVSGTGETRTLTITPAANAHGTAAITVTATSSAFNVLLDTLLPLTTSASFTLTVTPVADTPSVSNAATVVNHQTLGGLVIARNPADGTEVTHFRITGITGGTLFQHDGVTPITDGAFITASEGAAGLRFTPALDSQVTGHFTAQASIGATTAGLGGGTATADIAVSEVRTLVTGADTGGGPHVRVFSAPDGGAPPRAALSSFFGFDPRFSGGVRVAQGDLTGDGEPDIIVGAGPGGAPEVRIFDGATGAPIREFLAYEPGFTGGVYVAAGDVNGDGVADVITGPGSGRSGEVKVFSGADGTLVSDLIVFAPSFTGGVRVAAGDVNGDGRAELVVGSGPGVPADVRVIDGITGALLRTLNPYGAFVDGVFVAAGDVTGDGLADIVTGADAGGGPHVQVFDSMSGAVVFSFFGFEPSFTGGVRVAAGDVTGDGRADIIVGSGQGRSASVRVFDGATGAQLSELAPYGTFAGGLFAAAAAPINRMSIDTIAPGQTISGPLTIAGWGFVDNPFSAGVSAIHVWAVPVDGSAPTFLGVATLGYARPDVAAIFGAHYADAGFELIAAPPPPGVYDIAVFGRSAASGAFPLLRVVRVTITP